MRAFVLISFIFGASFTFGAEEYYVTTQLKRLISDQTSFGGCMARIEPSPTLVGCGAGWVTFDCNGDAPTTNKSAAARNFQAIQLAFVTGKQGVGLRIDNSFPIGGYCIAERVDNFP